MAHRLAPLALAGLGAMTWATVASLAPLPVRAVQGGPVARPYDQAVTTGRVAAQAVLGQTGSENCLRGKLTNAMLGLSASCEASGQRNSLCQLADQVAVLTGVWTVESMEETARQVIKLSEAGAPRP